MSDSEWIFNELRQYINDFEVFLVITASSLLVYVPNARAKFSIRTFEFHMKYNFFVSKFPVDC